MVCQILRKTFQRLKPLKRVRRILHLGAIFLACLRLKRYISYRYREFLRNLLLLYAMRTFATRRPRRRRRNQRDSTGEKTRSPQFTTPKAECYIVKKDVDEYICVQPARLHSSIKERDAYRRVVEEERKMQEAITEREMEIKMSVSTSVHKYIYKMVCFQLKVTMAYLEECMTDYESSEEIINSLLSQDGIYFVIFTWKIKNLKVYNMNNEVMRTYVDKRVHVSDGTDGDFLDFLVLVYRIRNNFTAEPKNVSEEYYFQSMKCDNCGASLIQLFERYNTVISVSRTTMHNSGLENLKVLISENWKDESNRKFNLFASYLKETNEAIQSRIPLEYSKDFYHSYLESEEKRSGTVFDTEKFEEVERTIAGWNSMMALALHRFWKPRYYSNRTVPSDEIYYWRRNKAVFTSIMSFIDSKVCRAYLDCVEISKQADLEYNKSIEKQWKDNYKNIRRCNTICESNVRILSAAEKSWNAYETLNPLEIVTYLASDVLNCCLVSSISCRLEGFKAPNIYLSKISNAMLLSCKKYISKNFTSHVWDQDLYEIKNNIKDCKQMYKIYKETMLKTIYAINNNINYSSVFFVPELIFGNLEVFQKRIKLIMFFLKYMARYSQISQCVVSGIDPFIKEYLLSFKFVLTDDSFNYLNERDTSFDYKLQYLKQQIDKIDEALKVFILNSFSRESKVDSFCLKLKRMEYLNLKHIFKDVIPRAALEIFQWELLELTDSYNLNRAAPVIGKLMPSRTGIVLWVRNYIQNIISPMLYFINRFKQYDIEIDTVPLYGSVAKSFNGLLKALFHHEIMTTSSFFKHYVNFDDILRDTLVTKVTLPGVGLALCLNFTLKMKILIKEIVDMIALGYLRNSEVMDRLKVIKNVTLHNQKLQLLFQMTCALKNNLPELFRMLLSPVLNKVSKRLLVFYSKQWLDVYIDEEFENVTRSLQDVEKRIRHIIIYKEEQGDFILFKIANLQYMRSFDSAVTVDEYYLKSMEHQKQVFRKLYLLSCALDRGVRNTIKKISNLMKDCEVEMDPDIHWLNIDKIDIGVWDENYISDREEGFESEMKRDWPIIRKKENMVNISDERVNTDDYCNECMDFYNYFHRKRTSIILNCIIESLECFLGYICDRKPLQNKPLLFIVDIQQKRDKIEMVPSLSKIQNVVNKIAAGMVNLTGALMPWGLEMKPKQRGEKYKKSVNIFEFFSGFPMGLLSGTGIGRGMPEASEECEECDFLNSEMIKTKKLNKEKRYKESLEREIFALNELKKEERRVAKMREKKKVRKELKKLEYLSLKKSRYIARLTEIEKEKRRKKRMELEQKYRARGEEFVYEEESLTNFIRGVKSMYGFKLFQLVQQHEDQGLFDLLGGRETVLQARYQVEEHDKRPTDIGLHDLEHDLEAEDEEEEEDLFELVRRKRMVADTGTDVEVSEASSTQQRHSSVYQAKTRGKKVVDQRRKFYTEGEGFQTPPEEALSPVESIPTPSVSSVSLTSTGTKVGSEFDTDIEKIDDPVMPEECLGYRFDDFYEYMFPDGDTSAPSFAKSQEDVYVDGRLQKSLYKAACTEKKIVQLIDEIGKVFHNEASIMKGVNDVYKPFKFLFQLDKNTYSDNFIKSDHDVPLVSESLLGFDKIKSGILALGPKLVKPPFVISTICFNYLALKECIEWKKCLAMAIANYYLSLLQEVSMNIEQKLYVLDQPINTVDDARTALDCLDNIKEEYIYVDSAVEKIVGVFSVLLDNCKHLVYREKNRVILLQEKYNLMKQKVSEVQEILCNIQESLLSSLTDRTADFVFLLEEFDVDFENNGPLKTDITADEASDRVIIFQSRLDTIQEVYERCCEDEKLFGLEVSEYEILRERKLQLNILQKLYGLYRSVKKSISTYYETPWKDINTEVIMADINEYQNRCRKLPKMLRDCPAYTELKQSLDNFSECVPIVELMSDKAMELRHWKKLEDLLDCELDVESPNFKLKDIMQRDLISVLDDVEDICVGAVKEKDIAFKLKQVETEWKNINLTFGPYKGRGNILLKGQETNEIIAATEDSLMILGSLYSNRYNAYYKKTIKDWINHLTDIEWILEKWLVVQNLWMYLEGVFLGGDIAKQLPAENKKFSNINKFWIKLMQRASDLNNCLKVCVVDGHAKMQLPVLNDMLDNCQRSLLVYLETKRKIFPRFYFLSDPAILEILGQASDPNSIEQHISNLFDNTAKIILSEDGGEITTIISREAESLVLKKKVAVTGGVESWLGELLTSTKESVLRLIAKCWKYVSDPEFRINKMISQFHAQISLLGLQMLWTGESERAMDLFRKDTNAMKNTNDYFLKVLNALIDMTTKDLTAYERIRFEAMVTIHVHQRDIFNDLILFGISSCEDFEWLKQERFYFIQKFYDCMVCCTDINFIYQNEYLGCSDRLVITPLTDRCYITLAQAIGMAMGGAPAGPAGTGKTETTKDMGKSLGKFVIVFNCSDQIDFRSLARTFKGLAMSGSWGCFDEFNRIELPVLSVAAQQIGCVLKARKEDAKIFLFSDGDTIPLNMEFGIFLTMNPGYAGRQELPENLKVLFRSVAMMVPDRQIIMRVKLASCGFRDNTVLARKFFVLYKLCEEQLSKQVHYDFGLRNILSVLRTLGAQKRANPSETEDTTLMRVLRDMNVSKLVDEDEPLFVSLINDLFPGLKLTVSVYRELQAAIETTCTDLLLENYPAWNLKIIQLYETSLVRHGLMTMGPTGSGKTSCITVLMKAMTICGRPHSEVRMNPKAITAPQMFGRLDVATNDWTDGIFSTLWRRALKTPPEKNMWIVLDGPVDAVWIENLNSVLDDTKTLTLANGDRIVMAKNSKLVFEPDNVDNASPATVSRMGMVFLSSSVLPWKAVAAAWLMKQKSYERDVFQSLFDQIYGDAHLYVQTKLKVKMNILEALYIRQFTDLMDGLLVRVEAPEGLPTRTTHPDVLKQHNPELFTSSTLQRFFLFCLMWTLGSVLEMDERLKLENFFLSHTSQLDWPDKSDPSDTVFEYFVDKRGKWTHWNTEVAEYHYPSDYIPDFADILIPNVDNVRTSFLIDTIAKQNKAVLLIGEQGTGKTVMLKTYLSRYNREEHLSKCLNFSYATTPNLFQRIIESYVEKRAGHGRFGPPHGKKLTIFIDDINMPVINLWGDQVTNEIVRQLIDQKGFYSLEKPGEFLYIDDLQFLAAMIHPGGGRNDIPPRLKRKFNVFNCTIPSDKSMDAIFGTFACGYFCPSRFQNHIVEFVPNLVALTRVVWQRTKVKMLPTPAKFHYVFNLRDLSRIWEGMLYIQYPECETKEKVLKLWKHECVRVISDRFTEDKDRQWFQENINYCIEHFSNPDIVEHYSPEDAYFVDFLREAPEPTGDEPDDFVLEAPKIYEEIPSWDFLKAKLRMFMTSYNEVVRGSPIDLVLFKDAIVHLMIVSRIIRTPRGSALLVGVGGSGKQCLTKLSSFIANYKIFQITLTRAYNLGNFMDDLKYLYRVAGGECQGITFIFADKDIKDEQFLEYLNNVLSAGEVANLFAKDEQEEILNGLVAKMRKIDPKILPTMENLYNFFIKQSRKNLHIVLSFSPVSEQFRSRALRFPGLISGCTMDWYSTWPQDALIAVADYYLQGFDIVCQESAKERLIKIMAVLHDGVSDSCLELYNRYRRRTYVTSKTFLSFLESYKTIYKKRKDEIDTLANQMLTGLKKLEEASLGVDLLRLDLEVKNREIAEAQAKADMVLEEVYKRSAAIRKVQSEVNIVAANAEKLMKDVAAEKDLAFEMLEQARPALEAAERALLTIKPIDIATVRKLGRPPHIIKLIMDAVLVLFRRKLLPVKVGLMEDFITPNWNESLKVMADAKFLNNLQKYPKERITAEMVDLLKPYFRLPSYNFTSAKKACGNVAGLLQWTIAMMNFYKVYSEVLPLQKRLKILEGKLQIAEEKYRRVLNLLLEKQRELDVIQQQLKEALDWKEAIAKEALFCKQRITTARKLLKALEEENIRWKQQLEHFKSEIVKLIGDVLILSGFLSYSGPFNQEFRDILMRNWYNFLMEGIIPFTADLNIVDNLVDSATIGEWNLQGLPNDDLSIQNAIIVTKASRYPLLIDPQSQGVNWIKNKEKQGLQVTVLNHKYFRQHVEDSLSLGNPLLIEDVLEDLDPVLDNILEKNFIKVGKSYKVKLGDKEVDVHDAFRMYMTTKLPNPTYTPEISARTSIVDFTVTLKGLEEQLLGRVILSEKMELEIERTTLIAEVTTMKRTMKQLEVDLLEKLTSVKGSLVDDPSVMDVLNTTKVTSRSVTKKLQYAAEAEKNITLTRDSYREVARRGSILYFLIVEMSLVNIMYQTSLVQFLERFELAMSRTEKVSVPEHRVEIIIEYLTYDVYKYQCRGLYEEHKNLFTLLLALKIDINRNKILYKDFLSFIKGGAALDLKDYPGKPESKWLTDITWLNLAELSKNVVFEDVLDQLKSKETDFKSWYDHPEPEKLPLPLAYEQRCDDFQKLMFIRALCPDRCWAQAQKYISKSLGQQFVESTVLDIGLMVEESRIDTPMICFLSMGSDPTTMIEQTAKKDRVKVEAISMGQGQEILARKLLAEKMEIGGWLLLQNCHLGTEFMNELFQTITSKDKTIHQGFRLWLTTEYSTTFPINLLHICIKYTNEPPAGLRAGLYRTYRSMSQDMLEFHQAEEYRPLLFAISFMHSIVQERRKFGALGWNIPYEFNVADWYASCLYLQNHIRNIRGKGIDWTALRYMIAEVHYGGRVTDDYDKRFLVTLTAFWFNPSLFEEGFSFYEGYKLLSYLEVDDYIKDILKMKGSDPPQVFGLHPNANITYLTNHTTVMLDTIFLIQPKESGQMAGETRESVVARQAKELMNKLPKDYDPFFVKERLVILGHLNPMNIFLRQEIDRIQKVITIVRITLRDLILAIEGTIIMNENLRETLDSIYGAKVPYLWQKSSWESTSIGFWFTDLLERNSQYYHWISGGRPNDFWMTGFFNPQGFLTAMRQEVSRAHKDWALDSVTLMNKVTKYNREDISMPPHEGVYVYGLFLEGGSWDLKTQLLQESFTKVLYAPLPVIHIYAINSTSPKRDDLYVCPVYKKKMRTDLNFITPLWLPCKMNPQHWIKRGTAMLCDTK